MRAEALADLVGRLSTGAVVLPEQVAAAGHTAAELTAAAAELTAVRRRWVALAPGDTWVVEWSGPGPRRRGRS